MTDPAPHGSPDPLRRLDHDLAAFEASRARGGRGGLNGAADGYRVLGQIVGGVLAGLGFGWLVDRFAHTAPVGVVAGLLIGSGLSIYAAIRAASRMSAKAAAPSPTETDEG